MLEKTNWAISFRPWIVVNGVTAEEDSEGIDQFMGNFDLNIYHQGTHSSTSILLRNNLRTENRGAIELNWSRPFPYSGKTRLMLQYFYGYGESLIDFDKLTNRVGIGLQLSDWL
jgi:phospholipase A1